MFKDSNHRHFQKGLDAQKFRANRYNESLSLRKKKREEHLQKKRRQLSSFNINISECIDNLNQYISAINSNNNILRQIYGATAIRQLLAVENNPPTSIIFKSGIIPKIINLMKNTYADNTNKNNPNNINDINTLILESQWIITNVCASPIKEYSHKVAEYGGIEAFTYLLRNSNDTQIIDQSIWGLGNICGDGICLRDRVVSTGILKYINLNFQKWSFNMIINTIWLISNILRNFHRNNISNDNILCISCILPIISFIFSKYDTNFKKEHLNDIYYCLNQFARIDDLFPFQIDIQSKYSIINKTVQLLSAQYMKYRLALNQQRHTCNSIKNVHRSALSAMDLTICIPMIQYIGHIVSGNDEAAQIVLDNDFINIIIPFLTHSQSSIRKECLWILSNFLAGTQKQKNSILSNQKLVKLIINSIADCLSVKREAFFCVSNALEDSSRFQKEILLQYNALEALCSLLNNSELCTKGEILSLIISGLREFLEMYGCDGYNPCRDRIEECNGLTNLEDVPTKYDISDKLYLEIKLLIQDYWGLEQDNYASQNINIYKLNPLIDNKTKQFIFGQKKHVQNNNDDYKYQF